MKTWAGIPGIIRMPSISRPFSTSMATVAASSRTMPTRLDAALSCAFRPSISFSTCDRFSPITAACN
jgi:hypothetical protein